MVQQPDLDQCQRLFQSGGDRAVGSAGFAVAAGVVVADDQRGRVVGKGAADDFARMHLGAVDGATEQFFEGDRAVAGVEEQRGEDLMRQSA